MQIMHASLCSESAGSYDTCPFWSVCSLDGAVQAVSPDRLLVSVVY